MEGGKIRSQSHFREYYWLRPDLTLNTLGLHTPILPVVLITLTPDRPARRFWTNLSYYQII